MQFNINLQSSEFSQKCNFFVDIFQNVFDLIMSFDSKFLFFNVDFEESSSASLKNAYEKLKRTIKKFEN